MVDRISNSFDVPDFVQKRLPLPPQKVSAKLAAHLRFVFAHPDGYFPHSASARLLYTLSGEPCPDPERYVDVGETIRECENVRIVLTLWRLK